MNNTNNKNNNINNNRDNKDFGIRLQALRRYEGLTVTKLANILDVPHSSISRWENGFNFPSIEKLILIAKHFNVSIDYLLGLSKCPKIFNTESESYMLGYEQVSISNLSEDEKMLIKAMIKVLKK